MTTKSPNYEQGEAILKSGGVLLSAGAGSGKTFVIIEHIVFLLKELSIEHSHEYLIKNIKNILSGITLMTFTTKASGEMSIRLTRRVEELVNLENGANKTFWNLVHKNLSSLKILTIHGLCHQLLRSGYWIEFPLEIELLDKVAHRKKIKALFDQWYELNVSHLKPQFLAHTYELFIAMEEIFLSPELRILWDAPQVAKVPSKELDLFFREWLNLRQFEVLFSSNFSYENDKKKKEKKGFQILENFSMLTQKHGKLNAKNFKVYIDFFEAIGRFPPPSKEMTSEEILYRHELKVLNEDIKKWGEDLSELELQHEAFKEWSNVLSSAFQYINKHYQDLSGFSFSDLEYYVYRGLENPVALNKIHESYSYFIVDEFQDTSFIQFDILKKLVGNDFKKLYAVGDRKQAIYGFRGGELQVFHECEELMKKEGNLSLRTNYRSKEQVVNFNNQFFSKVFPLGFKFEDTDPHHTDMETQVVPEKTCNNDGEVYVLRADIAQEIDVDDLDLLEAQILVEELEQLVKDDSVKSICVLYKKLRPSYYLIDLLKEKGISFEAQIKISFLEDPLISFFKSLVENVLNAENKERKVSSYFHLSSLASILGITELKEEDVNGFIQNSKILGIKNAFIKFFLSLGLTNSFHDRNFKLLFSICEIGQNDFLQIYHLLKENDDEYSTELTSGKKGKSITIMTAHASKGLEFDAVLLGGVHTNGGDQGTRGKIGKMPNSFRWKKSYDQRIFYKSPSYFLEAEILKEKNFSESKRLLYVACTRAIKKLSWVDLRQEGEELISDQNSWIKALRLAEVPVRKVDFYERQINFQNEVSFIQKDNLGLLTTKIPIVTGIISELSVTRLATLAECPFKFYLKNICKINVTEKFYLEQEEETPKEFYSSKERGTAIHLTLSKLFKKELAKDEIPKELHEVSEWALLLSEKYKDFHSSSEEGIKFSFFGNMISGAVDLYFIKGHQVVIWDFKTGKRDTDNEEAYWFQLMCYAYGIGKIYPSPQDLEVEMSLIYVDEKSSVSKKTSLSTISRELFSVWKKTESLYQVNLKHCPRCEYSSICKKSQR